MASDAGPVGIPGVGSVQVSGAPIAARPIPVKPVPATADGSGKVLPLGKSPVSAQAAQTAAADPRTNAASATAAAATVNVAPQAARAVFKPPAVGNPDPLVLVAQLNKYLNDSGRPDQFRVAPASGNALIEQINPATGAVVGEFSASEFPALARSVGVAGSLVDSRA